MRGTAASAAAPAAKHSNWRRRNVMRSRSKVYKPAEPAKSRSGRVGMSATVHRRRTQARRHVRHRNARAALLLDLERGREVDGSFEFILFAGRPHDPVLAELITVMGRLPSVSCTIRSLISYLSIKCVSGFVTTTNF